LHRKPRGKAEFTDKAHSTIKNETCGFILALGSVRFYCKRKEDVPPGTGEAVETGELKPGFFSSWDYGKEYGSGDCKVSAGDLISTGSEPSFWKKKEVEGPVGRELRIFWNCCCGTDLLQATARPIKK
jgi:hypothetical protein